MKIWSDIPAFTDDELGIIQEIRRAAIEVTADGRIEIRYTLSAEYCASRLHQLLRPQMGVK